MRNRRICSIALFPVERTWAGQPAPAMMAAWLLSRLAALGTAMPPYNGRICDT